MGDPRDNIGERHSPVCQRAGTMMLNAMQNEDVSKYAMTEAFSGEEPHAALVAATEENPALLRAILRLVKRYAPPRKVDHSATPPASKEEAGRE